ncbi:MAG TPA: GntR family transcriptional regulator [Blastocatellia bacterium]
MAVFQVDISSSVPVYRQIVDGLRVLLVNGDLKPGDQLPPVRRMALDLGVHFNTVAEAYRTLANEGWLDIRRRNGATVIEHAVETPAAPETHQAFARQLTELIAEAQSRGTGWSHSPWTQA